MTYTDTDPNVLYDCGAWQTYPVGAAQDGTLTGSADPDAALALRFQGTGVMVVYSTGPEGQTFTVAVDGSAPQTVNGYDTQYSYGHQVLLDGLNPGEHELRVTNRGGAIWIEGIQIQGELLPPDELELACVVPVPPTVEPVVPDSVQPPAQPLILDNSEPLPLPVGTYEQDYVDIIYTGVWDTGFNVSASGGSFIYTNDPNATVRFTIEGAGLILYRVKNANRGTMEVCIDGVCQTVENYNPTTLWQQPDRKSVV